MGDRHDDLTGVPLRQFLQAQHVPLRLFPEAFSRGHRVIGAAVAMLLVLHGVALADLVAVEPLKDAEVALAQTLVGDDLMAGGRRDDPCGIERAAEVAAVDGRATVVGKPLGQGFGLSPPFLGERAVQVTLPPAFGVPMGLAVPHGNDMGCVHSDYGSQWTLKFLSE